MGGKGGGSQYFVASYYLSMHYGLCHGPVDSIYQIKIKDNDVFPGHEGPLRSSEGAIPINNPDLFGGDQKEGGVKGTAYWFAGTDDQVMPSAIAAKYGRTPETMTGYRNIASMFFMGPGNNGFMWCQNNPYLPPAWVYVTRSPKGLRASDALIGDRTVSSGSGLHSSIYFSVDRSESMSTANRWLAAQQALVLTLDEIAAAVAAGDTADVGITFWSSATVLGSPLEAPTMTRDNVSAADIEDLKDFVWAQSPLGETDFREGINPAASWFSTRSGRKVLAFITDGLPTAGQEEAAETAAGMIDVSIYGFNIFLEDTQFTETIDNTPEDGVPVLQSGDYEGLLEVVRNAVFATFIEPDANPSHIIYEAMTNTDWGMGYPASAIDLDSFYSAADTFVAEQFGLSLVWAEQDTIENFVQEVLDHVQAMLFLHPRTGLFTLKPIRGDYDPDSLREFGPDNCDLTRRQRKALGETINEINIGWTDPQTEKTATLTFHDIANIFAQNGELISETRDYYGIRNPDLAAFVGARDIRTASQPLFSADMVTDRSGWDLVPGDCLKLNWPEDGLSGLVMRVQDVDYGSAKDGRVRVSLLEDIFALSPVEWSEPVTSHWTDPSEAPEPMDFVQFYSVPYPLLSTMGIDPEYPETHVGVVAQTAQHDAISYTLMGPAILPNGDEVTTLLAASTPLAPRGVFQIDLPEEPQTQLWGAHFGTILGASGPEVGGFLLIGDGTDADMELAMLDSYDSGTDTWTIARGVIDTIPRAWPAGTPCWFLKTPTLDPRTRVEGEDLIYKVLTRTSLGLLAEADAPEEPFVPVARSELPFRPANTSVDGVGLGDAPPEYEAAPASISVSWANRNRQMEDAVVLRWSEPSVSPEDGQTTRIDILDSGNNVIATHAGLPGTSFDIPWASFADATRVTYIQFLSERDGLVSLQGAKVPVIFNFLDGWGYSWGESWGVK